MPKSICQVCGTPAEASLGVCDACEFQFPYTFRDKKYGIEFRLEHDNSLSESISDLVATRRIAREKQILIAAWRRNHPAETVDEEEKADELLRTVLLPTSFFALLKTDWLSLLAEPVSRT
jgi:hypothetical protein